MLSAAVVLTRIIIFVLLIFYVVKPIYSHLVYLVECKELSSRSWKYREHLFAFTLVCALLSAWITEVLGVHSIFGSFLFGIIIPVSWSCVCVCVNVKINCHIYLGCYFASLTVINIIAQFSDMARLHRSYRRCGACSVPPALLCSFGPQNRCLQNRLS
jgi:hypothetical protein